MSDPAVSVLLPVRDADLHLDSCLASLERQTLTDFEVVAVDDGSTDGSGERLEAWAAGAPWLRVVHRPPVGLVAALNSGLAECRGKLVARMDADDISHPRRLELQAAALGERLEVGVVSCLVRHWPHSGVAGGFALYEEWLNELRSHEQMARERFVESPLAHPSVTVRRDVLRAAGGYRDCGWPEDYDLWLRLFAAGTRFAKGERPLHFWREHPDRLTRRDPRYSTGAFLRCKAHHLVLGPLSGGRPVVVWGAGRTGSRLARLLLDHGVEIAAFIDIDPRKIGGTARRRPVVAPEALPGLLGPGMVVLAAVASRGARELIRSRLEAFGLVEGQGFWCVA
jgi:cellulose synthase/poly-beta-1,6-N-acetylglucosamine synthase-like glycosyltransferase